MENIYKEYDRINFDTIEDNCKFLNESTQSFNFLDFYNSGEELNGLIVITPKQTIIIYPLYRHAYAMDKLYKMLYDLDISKDVNFESKINNINLRLVTGSSIQVQTFVPDIVNEYQKSTVIELFNQLTSIMGDIKYEDPLDQVIFYETYDDGLKKIKNLKVSDDCGKDVIPDSIIVSDIINVMKR